MATISSATLDQAARLLDEHPDFRVLRRLRDIDRFYDGPPQGPLRVGVAVDVETTGLDHESDRIIELAVQRFRFDALGRITQLGPCALFGHRFTVGELEGRRRQLLCQGLRYVSRRGHTKRPAQRPAIVLGEDA